jgi:phosphoglucomutase
VAQITSMLCGDGRRRNVFAAACPSGIENIYRIYAESFRGEDHLRRILEEAPAIVSDTLAAAPKPKEKP